VVNTGYKQSLYFGNETSYGSAATVDQPIGLVQSVSPTETNNLMKIRTLGGTRDYSNLVPGKFEVSGSFDYLLQGGAFLRMAIGEDTGTTATVDSGPKIHYNGTTNAYLHIMGSAASPTSDDFPSFTLEFGDDEGDGTKNMIRTYRGCRVNSTTINGTIDEPVKISVDWIGQSVVVSSASATSVSESTVDPYVFYQGQVYMQGTAVTSATVPAQGTKVCLLNSFDFSVNNNLEATWYIAGTCSGSTDLRALKSLIPKGRDYEANININFANKSMYQKFLGSATATTPQTTLAAYQVVIDFVRTGTIGTPGMTDDWMRVVLENVKFNDNAISGAPEDIISQNLGIFVPSAKVYVVDTDADYKA